MYIPLQQMCACLDLQSLCRCKLELIHGFFSFQHTFSSLLKQKSLKTSPPKSMAVSMRDVDPAFQGAGQKEYPSIAHFIFPVLFFYPTNIILLPHTIVHACPL